MIKLIFKIFAVLFAIILLVTAIFYLYASSSRYPEDSYSSFSSQKQSVGQQDTLSVVTYNMGYLSGMSNNLPIATTRSFYKNNEDSLIYFLETIKPDIVALQEIDFDSERSYNVDQLAIIAEGTQLQNTAKAVNWDKKYVPFPYWPVSNHFGGILSGQAVASHFSILETKSV
ncbi:MAG: endonuclease/exonuclease/phosphatase, partial [Cyclobacteriaceae bacterium]